MANKSYQNYQNKKNRTRQISKGSQTKTNSLNTKTNKQTNTETKTETIKLGEIKNQKQENAKQNDNVKNQEQKQQEKTTSVQNKNEPKTKTRNDNVRHAIGAIILIGTTLVVGGLASLLGGRMQDGLTKPPAFPPDWLFPAMWSIFYVAIGIAAYLAYFSVKDKKKRTCDLICYGIHLFFNMFWSLFYFRLNMLIFATIWLAFVVITAIIVTFRYYKANLASGIIFTVYTLWLLYAMYLALGITILNV